MRILHTSDWHLGRSFGPVSLLDPQQQFLDWLVDTVTVERIDLVVVAGDVFDRAVAPNEAVAMFRATLRRLAAVTRVAVVTGNHDGADRVNTYGDLLDLSGVILRGGYDTVGDVVTLDMADGPLDLVLLPFLDPQAAPDDYPVGDGDAVDEAGGAFERRVRRTHHAVLATAAATAAQRLRSPRSLVIAHAFVAGGTTSESERQLTVGGTGAVDAAIFAPFSYAALGHLHTPQHVTGTVRYSGTPMAYSFSEQHAKSVTIVDMASDGACTISEVPVPVGRPVLTITGTIEELITAPPAAASTGPFVRAILTDPGVVLDAKSRLSAVYPYVVEVSHEPVLDEEAVAARLAAGALRTMSAAEIAGAFWQAVHAAPPSEAQQRLLFDALQSAESELQAR